jgi:hypothetical protein
VAVDQLRAFIAGPRLAADIDAIGMAGRGGFMLRVLFAGGLSAAEVALQSRRAWVSGS